MMANFSSAIELPPENIIAANATEGYYFLLESTPCFKRIVAQSNDTPHLENQWVYKFVVVLQVSHRIKKQTTIAYKIIEKPPEDLEDSAESRMRAVHSVKFMCRDLTANDDSVMAWTFVCQDQTSFAAMFNQYNTRSLLLGMKYHDAEENHEVINTIRWSHVLQVAEMTRRSFRTFFNIPYDSNGSMCSICFDPMRHRSIVRKCTLLGCGHMFHTDCLANFGRSKMDRNGYYILRTCFICRTNCYEIIAYLE